MAVTSIALAGGGTLLLYNGRYSGEQIDAFLNRVQITAGTGALQPRIGGVRAVELPYGQYVTVDVQTESDGTQTIVFGVPRGKDGINGRDGRDGKDGKDGDDVTLGYIEVMREYSDRSVAAAYEAEQSKTAAVESAQRVIDIRSLSESWAVGGTGTREGEDENNSQFWADQSHAYAIAASGTTVSEVVYNVIIADEITGDKYALIVENGRLKILGVPDTVQAANPVLLDTVRGLPYKVIVSNGKIGIEEVST